MLLLTEAASYNCSADRLMCDVHREGMAPRSPMPAPLARYLQSVMVKVVLGVVFKLLF